MHFVFNASDSKTTPLIESTDPTYKSIIVLPCYPLNIMEQIPLPLRVFDKQNSALLEGRLTTSPKVHKIEYTLTSSELKFTTLKAHVLGDVGIHYIEIKAPIKFDVSSLDSSTKYELIFYVDFMSGDPTVVHINIDVEKAYLKGSVIGTFTKSGGEFTKTISDDVSYFTYNGATGAEASKYILPYVRTLGEKRDFKVGATIVGTGKPPQGLIDDFSLGSVYYDLKGRIFVKDETNTPFLVAEANIGTVSRPFDSLTPSMPDTIQKGEYWKGSDGVYWFYGDENIKCSLGLISSGLNEGDDYLMVGDRSSPTTMTYYDWATIPKLKNYGLELFYHKQSLATQNKTRMYQDSSGDFLISRYDKDNSRIGKSLKIKDTASDNQFQIENRNIVTEFQEYFENHESNEFDSSLIDADWYGLTPADSKNIEISSTYAKVLVDSTNLAHVSFWFKLIDFELELPTKDLGGKISYKIGDNLLKHKFPNITAWKEGVITSSFLELGIKGSPTEIDIKSIPLPSRLARWSTSHGGTLIFEFGDVNLNQSIETPPLSVNGAFIYGSFVARVERENRR